MLSTAFLKAAQGVPLVLEDVLHVTALGSVPAFLMSLRRAVAAGETPLHPHPHYTLGMLAWVARAHSLRRAVGTSAQQERPPRLGAPLAGPRVADRWPSNRRRWAS